MDRREVIKRTALLMGGVVTAPTLIGFLKGCSPKQGIDWKPEFFTQEQAYVVSEVAEIIIPKTDTPGAKEAGVPSFIEQMIFKAYKEEDRDQFVKGLNEFMTASNFQELSAEEQQNYVVEAHNTAFSAEQVDRSAFIPKMKELTMVGFFTSQPGATQVLQYEAVPGRYTGCQPLAEVGKTWAT